MAVLMRLTTAIVLIMALLGMSYGAEQLQRTQNARVTPIVLAVREASDAVVNISTERIVDRSYLFGDSVYESLFRRIPLIRTEKQTSLGSGVVIDDDNHVLTNAHVVLKASRISVKAADGDVYSASLVGWDVESDIALLRIDSQRTLSHCKLGTAKDLMIGETVISIGNPYGYSHSVTTGVVSALGRDVQFEGEMGEKKEILYDLIQTDAAINPGNSGGPLINLLGQVVGINTAILGSAEGMGFAIPIDRAMRVAEDLITYGEVHTPWLGINTRTVEISTLDSTPDEAVTAVAVTFVFASGPSTGKLKTGDIISGIGGVAVSSTHEFRARLKDFKQTEFIPLEIRRDGEAITAAIRATPFPLELAQSLCFEWLGFNVKEAKTTAQTSRGVEESRYIIVTRLKRRGPAETAGLHPGDILTQIDSTPLNGISDFQKALMAASGRDGIYVEVQRGVLSLRGTIP